MPDLLLELFSEEIPARMQAKAAEDLRKLVTDALVNAGLVYEGAKAFATPRRLALTVHNIPVRQPDVKEERKGPRVGAPENAIAGFLKAAGLSSIAEAKVQPDKKGDFYVAAIEKRGRAAIDVIAEIVPNVVRGFPWPKAMRWGDGALNWVRPLHSIVAIFGPETEDPEIVPFAIDGIAAGNVTYGHRFLAPGAIVVRRFDDYLAKLEIAKVVLDPWRREQMILADAKDLALAQGYELVEDAGLLSEAAGLVEWPVVLMGAFDEAFLSMPPEVIRTTIRNNQKCFVLTQSAGALPSPLRGGVGGGVSSASRDKAPTPALRADPPQQKGIHARLGRAMGEGKARLAPRFILVANTEAEDGGKAIVAGNERVIRARLSDAKFFYETDLKHWREIPLDERLKKFESIVFHEKLGTQAERIARIERLADEIAATLWKQRTDFFEGKRLDPKDFADEQTYRAKAKRAARLCKADLLTEVVGEFPELQGLMGKYYALAQGEDASVAAACEEHYKPVGPNDRVPTDPVSVAVALADKLDSLAGFWFHNEKPTSSGDPFALRRAALGVIRLIIQNQLRCRLLDMFRRGLSLHVGADFLGDDAKASDLLAFFRDRLKIQLRDQGARHDLVDAVLVAKTQDDLLMIVRRVEALGKFLDSDDGRNLLAGYKRATNIIRIEERKDKRAYTGTPDVSLYQLPEERDLAKAIEAAKKESAAAVAREDFAAAMAAIAPLRPRVDAFFEHVTVNVDDADLRENRLKLLNEIREATRAVADFSRIEG